MISIIMGTYNGEKYIREQLESIISQDFAGWKLFIFDDGSKDATERIVGEYILNYPEKIYYSKNTTNLGAARNFLNGLGEAARLSALESEYFCFADQDDVWVSDKLSRSLAKITEIEGEDKTPALVFSDVAITDSSLRVTAESYFAAERVNRRRTELNYLLMENKLIGGTVMINKALAEIELAGEREKRGIPERLRMHDWWLGLLAAAFGKIGFIEGITEYYRQHENNVVGGENFLAYLISRVNGFSQNRQRLYSCVTQGEEFLKYFGAGLSADKLSVMNKFVRLKYDGFFEKRASIVKNGFLKSGALRNLALMIFI